jgi:hypothetical protein
VGGANLIATVLAVSHEWALVKNDTTLEGCDEGEPFIVNPARRNRERGLQERPANQHGGAGHKIAPQ